MRAFALIADLMSVVLLLGWLPVVSALTDPVDTSGEHDVSDEEAVSLPNYDLYGGPQANRGAYDYVITVITYGGYGPPPPPSSSIVSSSLSSAINQSFTGTVTSSVLSSSPPNSTFGASSGLSVSSPPSLITVSTFVPTLVTSPISSLPDSSAVTGSVTSPLTDTSSAEGYSDFIFYWKWAVFSS
ncbi:hypothetical protein F5B18DRAFT_650324 [Nemania serpens]|nr:hypothetical protein F5B18DRAFT_650324 [Nemania serpens]